jgi:hypothetical protein
MELENYNIRTMKKKTLMMAAMAACVATLLISCLPVFDSMEQMRIVNRTIDTILIGSAKYNNIDSVKWLLECWGVKYDSTWTRTDIMGMFEVGNNNLIPHDSMGCYGETTLFGQNKDHKGYFFIIKQENAKNYSWKEICRYKLYDTLVVTREMLEPENIVEYRGNQNR